MLQETADLFKVNLAAFCLMLTHYHIYKQFMTQEQNEYLVRVLDDKNPPPMLGSEKFISWIKDPKIKDRLECIKNNGKTRDVVG